MAKVFISYKRQDKTIAENFKNTLEENGISVWWDEEIYPGDKWEEMIDQAIEESMALIVVLTSKALTSHWITYEWAYALFHNKPLFPLDFEGLNPNDIHEKLRKRQVAQFTEIDHLKVIKRLKEIQNNSKPNPEMDKAINSLQDWNYEDRQKAAIFLGERKYEPAVPFLLKSLKDEHHFVRISSAQALGNIGDAKAVPALLEVIQDTEEHPSVRHSAIEALRKIKVPVPAQILINVLEEDLTNRVIAAYAILEIGQDPDTSKIIKLLGSKNELVRRTAAWLLGGLKAHEGVSALRAALHDLDSGVRAHSAGALGDIVDPIAVPDLINLLRDKSPFDSLDGARMADLVCEIAAGALKKIGTPEAIKALEEWRQEQGR